MTAGGATIALTLLVCGGAGQDCEVRTAMGAFGVTREELEAAVGRVGNMRADVEVELQKSRARTG